MKEIEENLRESVKNLSEVIKKSTAELAKNQDLLYSEKTVEGIAGAIEMLRMLSEGCKGMNNKHECCGGHGHHGKE